MSEARKFSPSPLPDDERTTPTGPDEHVPARRNGARRVPWRRRRSSSPCGRRRPAARRPSLRSDGRSPRCRCRTRRRGPGRPVPACSSAQFSMIPLWTTDTGAAIEMRMGVLGVGSAVGGPSGVADAGRADGRIRLQRLLELGDPAYLLDDGDAVGGLHQGDSGRVVSTVLESLRGPGRGCRGPDAAPRIQRCHTWCSLFRQRARTTQSSTCGRRSFNDRAILPTSPGPLFRSHLRVLVPDVTTVGGREGIRRILR